MNIVRLVLMILALVCFLFAAIGISTPRGNLLGAGLFCWVLAELIGK